MAQYWGVPGRFVTLVRVLLAFLAMALLVMPVGIQTPDGQHVLALPPAVLELAKGNLGIGVINALLLGGAIVGAALLRLLLVGVVWIGFGLAGMLREKPAPPDPGKIRTCPSCGFVTRVSMADCPSCGGRIRTSSH